MFKGPLKGVVVPMVTPLLDNERLDVAGVERLVEHVVGGGVHGLFLLGTTGEAPSLPYELRRELVQRVCRQVDGRVPVVVGIGGALAMMSVKSALDAWWAMQSIFSGGMLGLFLLGFFSKRCGNVAAAVGVALGLLTIAWVSVWQGVLPLPVKVHANLSIVLGTMVICVAGFAVTLLGGRLGRGRKEV